MFRKMNYQSSVFDKAFAYYVAQLRKIDLHSVARKLRGTITENGLRITILGRRNFVSENGIIAHDNK